MIFSSLADPRLVASLRSGSVGVIPTDTVYGLAACATDKAAVHRLYTLKNRERKPGTLIAATVEQLEALGLDGNVLRAVRHLWPNPLSIIVPAVADLAYLDQGLGDLAVRIPKHAELHHLLQQTGPLVTSSANSPGEPPAANLAEAQGYFLDAVDFYVNGGDLGGRPSSTLMRWRDGKPIVLRQGAVTMDGVG